MRYFVRRMKAQMAARAAIPPSPRCSYTSASFFNGFSTTVSQPESSDTHFFNSFSVVLGILIAFTICLFAFARGLGRDYQLRDVRDDPLLKQEVAQIRRRSHARRLPGKTTARSPSPRLPRAVHRVRRRRSPPPESRRSKRCARRVMAPVSTAHPRPAIKRPGRRASLKARTRCTKMQFPAKASCRRRAGPPGRMRRSAWRSTIWSRSPSNALPWQSLPAERGRALAVRPLPRRRCGGSAARPRGQHKCVQA